MFRRIELQSTYESLEGLEIQVYGPVDLPSDGQIQSNIGVIKGLRTRRAISIETARQYRRVLQAKPSQRNLYACRQVIAELNILLEKSPSPNRGRVRSLRRRRNLRYGSNPMGYWHDAPREHYDPPARSWDPRTGRQLSGSIW